MDPEGSHFCSYIYVCVCVCVCICMCIYMCVCVCMYIYICVCVYIYIRNQSLFLFPTVSKLFFSCSQDFSVFLSFISLIRKGIAMDLFEFMLLGFIEFLGP